LNERLALEGGKPVRTERLPCHRPSLGPAEERMLLRALHEQALSGNGPYSRRLSEQLRMILGAPGAFPTPSCTAALELALLTLDIQPGDEVITPSFSFVSTANAIILRGGRPVFVDIEPETFNLDVEQIAQHLGARTRAIIPVHYAGMPCRLETLCRLADKHGLAIVEDSAHAIGSLYRGRPLGAWGDFGAFSFHGTKNLVCGEGGALIVNRPEWLEPVEFACEKGTNRNAFLRGEVDKYTWLRPGSSYLLSDLLAALLLAQLDRLEEITRRHREVAAQYLEDLAELAGSIRLPRVPENTAPNWHIFAILVAPEARDWMLEALRAEGIGATFHFVPLHTSPYATRHLGTRAGEFPVTERVAASLIRLPIFPDMTSQDIRDVVSAVHKVAASDTFRQKSKE